MDEKKLKHKIGLTNLYLNQISENKSDFMDIVLREALRKLTSGVDPSKVEDWVVNLEKMWRKL